VESGERVSNAWVTFPSAGDNLRKLGLIPNTLSSGSPLERKAGQLAPMDRPASHQLVGEVTAHQGGDG